MSMGYHERIEKGMFDRATVIDENGDEVEVFNWLTVQTVARVRGDNPVFEQFNDEVRIGAGDSWMHPEAVTERVAEELQDALPSRDALHRVGASNVPVPVRDLGVQRVGSGEHQSQAAAPRRQRTEAPADPGESVHDTRSAAVPDGRVFDRIYQLRGRLERPTDSTNTLLTARPSCREYACATN